MVPLLPMFGKALRRKDQPEAVSSWLARNRMVCGCTFSWQAGRADGCEQGCGYCTSRSMICVPYNGTSRCTACSKSHEKCSLQGEYRRQRAQSELGLPDSEFDMFEVR